MSNPSGPDQDGEPGEAATEVTEVHPEPPTEVLTTQNVVADAAPPEPPVTPGERRFTAPSGMDAGSTQIIDSVPDPATEIFAVAGDATDPGIKVATPQAIPPRMDPPKPPPKRRSWGWVVALILVIAALVAVAVLGTVLLTRHSDPAVSQQDRVHNTIQS